MSCRCTDDAAYLCCGGGLPPTRDGACSCRCHAAARWPLATPVVDPVRRAALALRVNLYELGARALDAMPDTRIALANAVVHELAAWPAPDAARVLRVLGAVGLAVPLAHAVVRQALAVAHARAARGLAIAVGGR